MCPSIKGLRKAGRLEPYKEREKPYGSKRLATAGGRKVTSRRKKGPGSTEANVAEPDGITRGFLREQKGLKTRSDAIAYAGQGQAGGKTINRKKASTVGPLVRRARHVCKIKFKGRRKRLHETRRKQS